MCRSPLQLFVLESLLCFTSQSHTIMCVSWIIIYKLLSHPFPHTELRRGVKKAIKRRSVTGPGAVCAPIKKVDTHTHTHTLETPKEQSPELKEIVFT